MYPTKFPAVSEAPTDTRSQAASSSASGSGLEDRTFESCEARSARRSGASSQSAVHTPLTSRSMQRMLPPEADVGAADTHYASAAQAGGASGSQYASAAQAGGASHSFEFAAGSSAAGPGHPSQRGAGYGPPSTDPGASSSAAVKPEPTLHRPIPSIDVIDLINLTGGLRQVDLTGRTPAHSTTYPAELFPRADEQTMASRPIIQSVDNPDTEHKTLAQPVKVNPKARSFIRQGKGEHLKTALKNLKPLLKNPNLRKEHELRHFGVKFITKEDLALSGLETHSTLGLRGAVARVTLTPGTPLIYSAKFFMPGQFEEYVNTVAKQVEQRYRMSPEDANKAVEQQFRSYSWAPTRGGPKAQAYEMTSFGAGNITTLVNHGLEHPNMDMAYVRMLDAQNRATPKVVVYFTNRQIEKGEQLLVDYGEIYELDSAEFDSAKIIGTAAVEVEPPAKKQRIDTKQESELGGPGGSSASESSSQAKVDLDRDLAKPHYYDDDDLSGRRQIEARTYARKKAKNRGVQAPSWAETMRPRRGASLDPPPEGIKGAKLTSYIKSARRAAKRDNKELPSWAAMKQVYVEDSLKRPVNFAEMTGNQKFVAVRRARREAELLKTEVPDWARPQRRPLVDNPLGKPDDFDDKSPEEQRK